MIKLIAFEMDGVLIDAKDWHYEALNKALGVFGFGISRYDHLTTYDGLPTRKKLEMLSLESGLPIALHDFINEKKQNYTQDMVHTMCKPTFNHEYAMSNLSAKGYKIAVASNAVRQSVDLMMEKANLSCYLDFVLSNEDVKKPKPDPEMYSTIISHFACEPEECLIIEDNENGIRAATASGGHVMVVKDVNDVTFDNIMRRINEVEAENK